MAIVAKPLRAKPQKKFLEKIRRKVAHCRGDYRIDMTQLACHQKPLVAEGRRVTYPRCRKKILSNKKSMSNKTVLKRCERNKDVHRSTDTEHMSD